MEFSVSTKLNIHELRQWVEQELRGYNTSAQIPEYRRVQGEVKVQNPYHSWQTVIFENPKAAEVFSQRLIGQSIPEIENTLGEDDNRDILTVPFAPEMLNALKNSEFMHLGLIPTLIVSRAEFYGIVETVRNTILEWSLKLEQDGILGDGMTFTREEVQKASMVTYNIHNFTGIMGNVLSSQIQVGDYNSIYPELKRLGIPQEERKELETIVDELPKADQEKKPALLKRGAAWVVRNAATLGTLSETLRKWFEPTP